MRWRNSRGWCMSAHVGRWVTRVRGCVGQREGVGVCIGWHAGVGRVARGACIGASVLGCVGVRVHVGALAWGMWASDRVGALLSPRGRQCVHWLLHRMGCVGCVGAWVSTRGCRMRIGASAAAVRAFGICLCRECLPSMVLAARCRESYID